MTDDTASAGDRGDHLSTNRRRLAVAALCALMLGVAAVVVTALLRDDTDVSQADASTVTASDPPKTAPPPTSTPSPGTSGEGTDIDTGEASTAGAASTSAAQPTAPASPRKVTVVLSYSGYVPESSGVIAGGYADAVIEATGTCTLTLTKDGQTRQVSGPATPDAATTSCGELLVPQDQLSGGIWHATVSYASPTSQGTSSSVTVEVP